MERLDRLRPKSCPPPCMVDKNADRIHVKTSLCKERIHSWPFWPSTSEPEFSLSPANISRASWHRSVSIGASRDRSSQAHLQRPQSCLLKQSTELPGAFDSFPETGYLACAATTFSDDRPPLPPKPRTRSSQNGAAELSKSAYQSYQPSCSASFRHADQDLRRRGGSDNHRHEYTLKEALKLLPNEVCDSRERFILDSSTGRTIPIYLDTRQEQISLDTEVPQDGTDRYEQRSQFYGQNVQQLIAWQEPHIQCGSRPKRPIAKLVAKAVRPLTWLFSKFSRSPARPSEKVDSVNGCQPVNPRDFQGGTVEPQNPESCNPLGEKLPLLAQSGHVAQGVCQAMPENVRRLSITGSFGPTLAQSIEEATRKPKFTHVAAPASFRVCSRQPVPSAPRAKFLSRQTPPNVRFQEPEGCRRRPHLQIQVPFSPPVHPFPRVGDLSRQPRSPPPRSTQILSDQCPDANLSLRGGCLPISRTRHPPPQPRIDPACRPADDVGVPPGLWYLAGGRPMLRDKAGQPCYHGQSKPRRRFKNRRGLDQADINRAPNAQPCEPLTFGHLRTWKQNSRPADRLNSRTGYMEPVYRPFWQEFAHSVSQGKVGTKRPKRHQGAGQAHYGRGQGMADAGDGLHDRRSTDVDQDDTGIDEPDPAMGVGR